MSAVGQLALQNGDLERTTSLGVNGRRQLNSAGGHLSEVAERFHRILFCLPDAGTNRALRDYSEYVAGLLHGQMTCLPPGAEQDLPALRSAASGFDLILYAEPDQTMPARILLGARGRRVTAGATTSVLYVPQPRRPILSILLVLRVEPAEELAVDWAVRFTQASGAGLTVLPLVPAQAATYGPGSHLHAGIGALLTPGTTSGERLRFLLQRLELGQVDGTVRVRQGDPLRQICWEIDEGAYDLVVIAAEQGPRLRRWLFGALVGPLVSRVNCPLLVAGPSGHPVQGKEVHGGRS